MFVGVNVSARLCLTGSHSIPTMVPTPERRGINRPRHRIRVDGEGDSRVRVACPYLSLFHAQAKQVRNAGVPPNVRHGDARNLAVGQPLWAGPNSIGTRRWVNKLLAISAGSYP